MESSNNKVKIGSQVHYVEELPNGNSQCCPAIILSGNLASLGEHLTVFGPPFNQVGVQARAQARIFSILNVKQSLGGDVRCWHLPENCPNKS